VVVTDRGPDQVVKDGLNGLVVKAGDPDALRRAIVQLEEDPEIRQQLGEAGRRTVLQHTWTRYGRHFSDLLESLKALS
jgi:glycosyltransferase involved in cell wall biosynthesis